MRRLPTMSISRQHLLTTLFGVGCLLAAPSIAAAADPSSEVARLQSDVARLERELSDLDAEIDRSEAEMNALLRAVSRTLG